MHSMHRPIASSLLMGDDATNGLALVVATHVAETRTTIAIHVHVRFRGACTISLWFGTGAFVGCPSSLLVAVLLFSLLKK
jgi:hypothetical protein